MRIPDYPGPQRASANVRAADLRREYVGNMQTGTMSVIDPLTDEALDQYTEAAQSLSPYRDSDLDVRICDRRQRDLFPAGPAVADRARDLHHQGESHLRSGVRQNRQGQQRSVADACSTNRLRPIITSWRGEFVLFDNFYVNADVSADGHNWATAGIAPDYTQRMWPNSTRAVARSTISKAASRPILLPPVISGPTLSRPAQRAELRPLGGEQGASRTGRHSDRESPGPGAAKRHEYEVSRLRSGLSGYRSCARFSRRSQSSSKPAATMPRLMHHAAGQRSYQRHHARQAVAALACSPITITRSA